MSMSTRIHITAALMTMLYIGMFAYGIVNYPGVVR
jgi:hypothetical protein